MSKRGLLFFILGLITFPILGLVVLNFGWWPWRATTQPAGWENRLGRKAFRAAVRRDAAKMQCPIQINDEVLKAGMRTFRTNCAGRDLGKEVKVFCVDVKP